MTGRRRWMAALTAVACLVLALGVGYWWLFNTGSGAKWGFERMGSFFPGRLDVKEMQGPLRGPIEIRNFAYKNDSLSITADRVFVRWHLHRLLQRRLDIDQLHAENVNVVWGAPGTTPQARDSLSGPFPDLNLPVSLVIREGILNRLTIKRPGNDSAVVIDRVELDARSDRRDSLRVNHLTVKSRLVDLEFAGVAFPRGAYPLALRGSWVYRPARLAPLSGRGTIAGTLDSLRVTQALSGPFTADIDLSLFRPLRANPRVQGQVAFAGLAPRLFDPTLPDGVLRGRVAVAGDRAELVTQGDVHGPVGDLGPLDASFRLRRTADQVAEMWRVDDLVVTRPGSATRLTARGTVTDAVGTAGARGAVSDARFDLVAAWTAAGWPLQGEPWVESERGTARIQGTSRDFGIHLQALLAGRNLPPGTWRLDGRGSPGHLAIHTIIADILDGRITGAGSVAFQPRVRWDLTFQGESINPAVVWPAYPGALAFAGKSEGVEDRGGASGRILVSRLGGTLRTQSISGAGTLTASHGQYALSQAAVQWGPNRAEASGEFGHRWNLDWKLDAPQVGAALAQGSGSVHGTGSIRGVTGRQRFTGTLAGDSLFFGDMHAGAIRAAGDVDLAPGGLVRLDANATQLNAGGRAADRAMIAASGTRDQNQIRASLAYKSDSAVAVFTGAFREGAWNGLLSTLDLVNTRAGHWTLASPARLSASRDHATLAGFALQSGTSRATLDADWTRDGPWHLDSRLDRVPLALVTPELPPRLRLEGAAGGHIVARATSDGHLYADVDVVPGPGRISYNTASGQWVPTAFQNARIHGTADGNRVDIAFGGDLVGAGTVRGSVAWPAFGAPSQAFRQPVHGTVSLHMQNLALAQGFTTELDSTSGTLDADLEIAGTLQDPFIYGPLSLRNGSAEVPRYGLHLREMNVQGRGTPGGEIALDGSVRSGSGVLTIKGTAAVAPGAKPIANVSVSGQRIQAMNSEDMEFVASPDIQVKLDGRRVDVTGQVEIPEGKIDLSEQYNKRTVRTSPDVVYAGADTLPSGAYEVHTSVKLVLGDKLTVRGFGLDAAPTGTVQLIDAPGLPTLGRGRLDIQDGKYQIYGQTLNVETGSLIFGGGPIANPAVRARASRVADDGVKAGFDVSGTLQQPDVQVFSEPAMGQSEALSYVMFGKPIESANLSQGQMASTMATTLGIPGTNMLAHGIASGVGIEDARVEVGSGFQNTSLMLGTHLSPKLYVSAGMDVFQSTSSLRLKYILNRIFTIEAETAHQNRVDLLYTVEK